MKHTALGMLLLLAGAWSSAAQPSAQPTAQASAQTPAPARRDPFTRPPPAPPAPTPQAVAQAEAAAAAPPAPLRLRALVLNGPKSLANIDGDIVGVGERARDYQVLRIDAGGVLVSRAGQQQQLTLIEKEKQ